MAGSNRDFERLESEWGLKMLADGAQDIRLPLADGFSFERAWLIPGISVFRES